jgi:hypothetical protein
MSTTLYCLEPTGRLTSRPLTGLTTLYRDPPTDALFATYGADVSKITGATARAEATWSKRIVLEKYETFAWLEVRSKFTDADGVTARSVTVTVTDTAAVPNTLASLTVSDRTPVRLPPFREKEVVITVTSRARVTGVFFASSSEELKAL